MPLSPTPSRHRIRVVLSSTAILPFITVWKAAALAIAQLGAAAFFIAGVTRLALGDSAGWFVLSATIVAVFVRAIDIESWGLLLLGGFLSLDAPLSHLVPTPDRGSHLTTSRGSRGAL